MKSVLIAIPFAAALLAQPAFAQHIGVHATVVAPAYVAPGFNPEPRDWRAPRWDQRAPRISEVTPSQGDRVSERGRTRITARIHDMGSGIDYDSIVLRIDGRRVQGPIRIEGDELRYREDLAPGRHWAELTVRDRAGNATRRAWSFDVVNDSHHGWGYGSRDDRGWDHAWRR